MSRVLHCGCPYHYEKATDSGSNFADGVQKIHLRHSDLRNCTTLGPAFFEWY